jgi:hypothetical protein
MEAFNLMKLLISSHHSQETYDLEENYSQRICTVNRTMRDHNHTYIHTLTGSDGSDERRLMKSIS